MKQSFVKSWNSTTQPRKQRKYRYNAPLHIQGTFLSVNVSKDLRKEHNVRSVRARKGDTIKIVRGVHKGKTGKIDRVSIKYTTLFVSGIERQRKDGTKALIPVNPTNAQLITLTNDKKRLKSTSKSSGAKKETTKQTSKEPVKEATPVQKTQSTKTTDTKEKTQNDKTTS